MKIVSLNIAGRQNFGQDFTARIARIVSFLEREQADLVLMQEVTFDRTGTSLVEKINQRLSNPYPFYQAHLNQRMNLDQCSPGVKKKLAAGLIEHDDDTLTDGLGILSLHRLTNYHTQILTPVPPDDRGRPDFWVRSAQIAYLKIPQTTNSQNSKFSEPSNASPLQSKTLKFANLHLASNNNAYLQLQELLTTNHSHLPEDRTLHNHSLSPDDCAFLAGDFNMSPEILRAHADLWSSHYNTAYAFAPYTSFPNENTTFDHFLLSKRLQFTKIATKSNLSDHNALIVDFQE